MDLTAVKLAAPDCNRRGTPPGFRFTYLENGT